MDEVNRRIENLPAAARARFERLLLDKAFQKAHGPAIPARDPNRHAPLSFEQQRLWFLQRLDPDSSAYNTAKVIRIRGALNVAALQDACTELERSQEVLRMRVEEVDGEPVQLAVPPADSALEFTDLSDSSKTEEEVVRTALEEACRPYVLEQGPVWRCRLYRLSEDHFILLLGIHHIASDGWTMGLLLRELSGLYAAGLGPSSNPGVKPNSSPAPAARGGSGLQYADYAAWQRGFLRGARLEEKLRYWRAQLGGELPVLALHPDRPRAAIQSFRGATFEFTWPPELMQRAAEASREHRCTVFMFLLAAFQVLLYRYTGQEDLVVGTAVAGRNQPGTGELIGCFVNTLALRANLEGEPTFRYFLGRVRETCLNAYSHQDVPFDKLVEELHPERSLSHNPVVQCLFEVRELPQHVLPLPGLDCEILSVELGTATFDLAVSLHPSGRGLAEYSTDLFEEETLRRMLGHYRILVEAFLSDPDVRVSQAAMLDPQERQQVFRWNQTQVAFQRATLTELMERRIEASPGALALQSEEQRITFEELNRRANRLAHRLCREGAKSGAYVAICLERGIDFPIAILAVLKTGAAYVPLDAGHPRERVATLLRNVNPVAIVTTADLDARLELRILRCVHVDREEAALREESESNVTVAAGTGDPAYIIHTSGSTGEPKGVLVSHAALANHAQAIGRCYALAPGDRVLQFAPLSVDLAAEEILPTWIAGAVVVIAPPLLSVSGLQDFASANGITILNCASSFWQAWVAELKWSQSPVPASLRLVVTGSETVPGQALAAWREIAPPRIRWINAYGLTETAITSLVYESVSESDRALTPAPSSVPIGRPIANVTAYVLDRHFQLLPIGVPGELYIGGAGLATGYLDDPQLTAAKFVTDPFSRTPGARLCRTGDRARYLPGGNIEHLGRADGQIKLRGFRIEPGEIAAALLRHPEVESAAVALRAEAEEDRVLTAYVVPRRDASPASEPLRSFLAETLPAYAVPFAFVFLDRLPLTANGKIDYRALPSPAVNGHRESTASPANSPTGEPQEPRDEMEKRMARVWAEVLPQASLGRDRNFFAAGGHSLLAIRLISRIEREFERRVPLAALFQKPTIAGLCQMLRDPLASEFRPAPVPMQTSGSLTPMYWVHNLVTAQRLVKELGSDRPFRGIPEVDPWNLPVPYRLDDVIASHLRSIRELQPHGPYVLGGWCNAGIIAYEIARRLEEQGESVGLVALFDSVNPAAMPGLLNPKLWLGRMKFHRDRWRELHPGASATYLRNRFAILIDRLWSRLWQFTYRLCRLLRRDLPAKMVDQQQIEIWSILNHKPRPYRGRILLFRCTRQPAAYFLDATYGWRTVAENIDVADIDYDHFAMFDQPCLPLLAERIRAQLDARAEQAGA